MDGGQAPEPQRGAGPLAPTSKQKWLGKAPTFRYPELHRGAGGASGEPASSSQATASPGLQSEASTAVQMSAAMGFSRLGGGGRVEGVTRQSSQDDGPSSSESERHKGVMGEDTPDSPLNSPPPEGSKGDKDGTLANEEGDLDDLEMDGDLDDEDQKWDDEMEDEEGEEDEGIVDQRIGLLNFDLHDVPDAKSMILSSFQHIIALVGSMIIVPMILVPRMGGSDVNTAEVIQAVLMVTGLSTILHILFGTRLPLVQGSSLVYLAPALAIASSPDVASIADASERFSSTMRELMGAVICSSLVQLVLGYSGSMGLLIELINPVVVAPTMTAVGLSFFSYGFPKIGACFEIGIPQLILAAIFCLYLRRVSLFGSRFFQIHAVSLSLVLIWFYAFILTAAGAYNFGGCNTSNLLVAASSGCARSQVTMDMCRTDASSALAQAPWTPAYPFRFGTPTFKWSSICIMLTASLISIVDSVGNYHASSLLVAVRPPTGGVVSRGIGMEGVTSIIAGMFGTGTGATTISDNVHLIAVTRMGSRAAVMVGAGLLIFFSLFGKVGGFLAQIPPVMIGGLMCIMAPMLCAFGLSSLRYVEMGSSRNLLITGLALFLSISVPEYFNTYTLTNGHGPVNTSNAEVNFFFNSLFSLHMFIAFTVSFILDNTVPGSPMERGLYVWSGSDVALMDDGAEEDYNLPFGIGEYFHWAWWLGLSS